MQAASFGPSYFRLFAQSALFPIAMATKIFSRLNDLAYRPATGPDDLAPQLAEAQSS
jgi:hypothetical protein